VDTGYSSFGKSSEEDNMFKAKPPAGDERNRIWQILGCPGARLNPSLAETLAYNSSVSASVAVNVLAHDMNKALATLPGGSAKRK
jgi:hypothetical protein